MHDGPLFPRLLSWKGSFDEVVIAVVVLPTELTKFGELELQDPLAVL